ncbi:MAG TPA: hypothetical protein VFF64_08405 [Candidatus Eremiobacteraceae bacterium]|nr:hypothetical protein [Candidatus Eremiobacteraceae bacterium]
MSTATILPFSAESSESTAAMERYRQAYQVARTIADFAEKAKFTGLVLGGVLVVASSVAGQWAWARHSGFSLSLSLLACSVFPVLAGYLWEKVLQALGRLVEMNVDSAVNSSPFLSDAQRASAMFERQELTNVTNIDARIA